MSAVDALLQAGYTPAGGPTNVVPVQGTDPLALMNQGLAAYQAQYKADQVAQQKEMGRKLDMYKTLRDSGYQPADAYNAVIKNKMPEVAGGLTDKEKKIQAQTANINAAAGLRKAQTLKVNAETNVVNLAPNQKALTLKILTKIAGGQKLTTGEQKVYDEVIRKYGNRSALELALGGAADSSAAAGQAGTDTSGYVPMLDPSGTPKRVHPEDVSKALAQGWKRG